MKRVDLLRRAKCIETGITQVCDAIRRHVYAKIVHSYVYQSKGWTRAVAMITMLQNKTNNTRRTRGAEKVGGRVSLVIRNQARCKCIGLRHVGFC